MTPLIRYAASDLLIIHNELSQNSGFKTGALVLTGAAQYVVEIRVR
jgi:hypothetical protein